MVYIVALLLLCAPSYAQTQAVDVRVGIDNSSILTPVETTCRLVNNIWEC